MHTESVVHDEDEPSQPLVQWFPRGGAIRSVSPDVVTVAGLAIGLFAAVAITTAAVVLTRRMLDD